MVNEAFERIYEEADAEVSGVLAAAGIQQMIPSLEYPAADFRRVMDVNVAGQFPSRRRVSFTADMICIIGTFFTIQAAARQMQKRNIRGSIAIVASMSGSIANKGKLIRSRRDRPTDSLTHLRFDLFGLQHEQRRPAADVSKLRCRMGTVRYPSQRESSISPCNTLSNPYLALDPVTGIHPNSNDRWVARRTTRPGGRMAPWIHVEPLVDPG